jgi:coatomer subunit beta
LLISVYDVTGAASDRNVVVLNDIHIDIMDYIVPASCNDSEFRQMWAEFEWENKVAVNTNISDLRKFLEHVIKCTNMKCLTPEKVSVAYDTLLNLHKVNLLKGLL